MSIPQPPWQKHIHRRLDTHKTDVVVGTPPAMRHMEDAVAAGLAYCFPEPLVKHGVDNVVDGHV